MSQSPEIHDLPAATLWSIVFIAGTSAGIEAWKHLFTDTNINLEKFITSLAVAALALATGSKLFKEKLTNPAVAFLAASFGVGIEVATIENNPLVGGAIILGGLLASYRFSKSGRAKN